MVAMATGRDFMAKADDRYEVTDFLVSRANLRETKLAAVPVPAEIDDGQVLLKIDSFGLSANNITYAVFGDAMSYWNFFQPQMVGDGCPSGDLQKSFAPK